MSDRNSGKTMIWLLVSLSAHLVAVVVLLGVLLKWVPQYVKIFKDFNTKLPDTTILVIHLSRCTGMYWYLAVPLLGVDAAILFSLLCLGKSARWVAGVWAVGVLLGLILVAGLAMAAVHFSLLSLFMDLAGD
jgi:type II secretory pathway component PulF